MWSCPLERTSSCFRKVCMAVWRVRQEPLVLWGVEVRSAPPAYSTWLCALANLRGHKKKCSNKGGTLSRSALVCQRFQSSWTPPKVQFGTVQTGNVHLATSKPPDWCTEQRGQVLHPREHVSVAHHTLGATASVLHLVKSGLDELWTVAGGYLILGLEWSFLFQNKCSAMFSSVL